MKKFLISLLVVVLSLTLIIGMAACNSLDSSVEGIKKYGKLLVATDPNFPPFEYTDESGNVVGWDIDVAKEFAKALGVELEIVKGSFDAVLLSTSTGKAHIAMAGISRNPVREKSMTFTDDVFDSTQVIIVRSDETSINGPMDLAGKKVGSQLNTVGYELSRMSEDWAYDFDDDGNPILTSPILGEPSEAIGYDSGALAVQALIGGIVDAVIIDKYPAQQFVANNAGKVKICEQSVFDDSYSFAVKLGNTELRDFLNEVLAEMKADGRMDAINEKYFG